MLPLYAVEPNPTPTPTPAPTPSSDCYPIALAGPPITVTGVHDITTQPVRCCDPKENMTPQDWADYFGLSPTIKDKDVLRLRKTVEIGKETTDIVCSEWLFDDEVQWEWGFGTPLITLTIPGDYVLRLYASTPPRQEPDPWHAGAWYWANADETTIVDVHIPVREIVEGTEIEQLKDAHMPDSDAFTTKVERLGTFLGERVLVYSQYARVRHIKTIFTPLVSQSGSSCQRQNTTIQLSKISAQIGTHTDGGITGGTVCGEVTIKKLVKLGGSISFTLPHDEYTNIEAFISTVSYTLPECRFCLLQGFQKERGYDGAVYEAQGRVYFRFNSEEYLWTDEQFLFNPQGGPGATATEWTLIAASPIREKTDEFIPRFTCAGRPDLLPSQQQVVQDMPIGNTPLPEVPLQPITVYDSVMQSWINAEHY
ncbi:hypothetical protein BRCON_2308 [Candidatus Sumerlaea chitinivorans]|uniref:Uncharacterized protein n=1 Tax=Sumerlaea chitinivorans TaxID=2250252 RepID=A0A2Z4Y9L6_SUMC1|nr:hypothetical protein BRCON_2308 [Candidatus Sumerlaea chitinivorans]